MDDVLNGAHIDIYGLVDVPRRRTSGQEGASRVDGALLNRSDLSKAVKERPDLKVRIPTVRSNHLRRPGGVKYSTYYHGSSDCSRTSSVVRPGWPRYIHRSIALLQPAV